MRAAKDLYNELTGAMGLPGRVSTALVGMLLIVSWSGLPGTLVVGVTLVMFATYSDGCDRSGAEKGED